MSVYFRNRRIYDATTKVRDALSRLEQLGCTVLDIRIGGCQPVISIEPDSAAQALPGAVYMRERIRGQAVASYACPMLGCQIRWSGADPHHTPPTPRRAEASA